MYNQIENIVFDLGRVVVDINPQNTYEALAKLSKNSIKPAEVDQKMAQAQLWRNYESGNISDQEFRHWLRQNLDIEANDEIIDYSFNALILKVDPEKIKLIKKLGRNYNLFVLSNTSKIHMDYFLKSIHQQYGILHFWDNFKKVFLSYQMNAWKPEPAIYQKMLLEGNLKPAKTLFFDDLLVNVQAAQALEIHAVQILPQFSFVDFFKQHSADFKL